MLCKHSESVASGSSPAGRRAGPDLTLLVGTIVTAALLAAPVGAEPEQQAKSITAGRAECAPIIDGRLDDECWNGLAVASSFVQMEPHRGTLALEQTEAYVAYDDTKIYFGFRCRDSQPGDIVGTLRERDAELWQDDAVEIFLDTFHDQRSCYYFMTNVLGAKLDGRVSDEGRVVDDKWDSEWETCSCITPEGWECEVAIPFSEIRYKFDENPVWGVNFYRTQKPLREDSYWVNTGENIFAVSQFGNLGGFSVARLRNPVEVIPYSTGRWEKYRDSDDVYKGKVGLDVEHSFVTNVTANLTIRPDFAHIEADQGRFNLSYEKGEELYLKEKRPFFLEGLELLQTPFDLFYTRRMNEIDYGLKTVGKVRHTNLAFMGARTGDTEETFAVLRAQSDVFETGSVGILASGNEYEGGYSRAVAVDASIPVALETRVNTQVCGSFNPEIDDRNWAGLVEVERRTRTYSIGGQYEDVGANFNVRQGFISPYDIDKRGADAWGILVWPRNRLGLRWVKSYLGYSRRENHDGMLTDEQVESSVAVLGENRVIVRLYGDRSTERYGSLVFRNHSICASAATNYGGWSGISIYYQAGELYDYDMEYILGSLSFTLVDKLAVEFASANLRLDNDNEWINNFQVNYQISENLFWRMFAEGNTENEVLKVNTLLGYHLSLRTLLYLAYNETRENVDGRGTEVDRVVFLKVSYGMSL